MVLVHYGSNRIRLYNVRMFSISSGFTLAKNGIGTAIGRRTVSKGRQYLRVWIYVPTKVSEDTAFPFKVGEPCEVEIDAKRKGLVIKSIDAARARELGWSRRDRFQPKTK